MRNSIAIFLILMLGLFGTARAHDLSGFILTEGSFFFKTPLFPQQQRVYASLALQSEYYHQWNNGSSFTFVPFLRLDSHDSRRSHLDIRELNILLIGDPWELRVGFGKVFWGVTEFVHLVDIINQTDLVENIDEEDKLGQPMVHLSLPWNWGVFDAFVLPYFRKRTFPGPKGRPRLGLVVDTSNPQYESVKKERHIDFALRYSHTIRNWDFGIYHFYGTGREPTLIPDFNNKGEPTFIPFYHIINQTGVDVQLLAGEWLYKLEAFYRTGQGDDFFATVAGFEYTFTGIAGSQMDLGLIGEGACDSRGKQTTTPYENDVMLGVRLGFKDAAGTELLAGVIQDLRTSARIARLEVSRRISANWRADLTAWFFLDFPEDDLFYDLRNDDFLRFELAYYF